MIKVKFFAVCKDYFQAEESFDAIDVSFLKLVLVDKNPLFNGVLPNCKFVIGRDEVADSYVFQEGDVVLVLPPSSGG